MAKRTVPDSPAEAPEQDRSALPTGDINAGSQDGAADEDDDGLDEVARALREAAEAPVGREAGED